MNQIIKKSLVDVVDALHGFAVVAIMLLHFIEHFIYGVYPERGSETATLINQSVWDSLFFLFAVMGFTMIPLRKLSQKALLIVALVFLIQPVELLECFGINLIPTVLNDAYYPALKNVVDSGNFWQMVWENITTGQLASLFWAVDAGRLLQAPGLFILGMILARENYFSRDISFWVKAFVVGFISAFVLYVAKSSATDSLQIIFTMWYNIAFTAILVSTFVILYQSNIFKKMTNGLRFYGRMSLTNYVSQSIIGSIIFFPYAFGLASVLGIAWSLGVGILVMLVQIWFCKLWLKRHKQGPLEYLWHRATWLK